jgi:hypothetical protein
VAGLDSYVKLYCNFNGVDGSQNIIDNYGGKTITANGNAQLDTAQKKFGTACLLLDGNGDYLSIPDSEDFNLGGNNFTVDCQVRINALPSSGNYACIFAQRATATSQNSLGLFIKNNSGTYQLYASFTFDGVTEKTLVTDYAFVIGQFYHIEICREGGWLGYFVGGENIGSYYVGTNSLHNSTAEFKIGGSDSTTTNYLNGWIDEFRFSKGISRHTLVSYTPPTSQYTADSYDVILAHMDGNNDSTTFVNDGYVTITPKFGTGCGYFDGVGDGVSLSANVYTTGDATRPFSLRCWINPFDLAKYQTIYVQKASSSLYANGDFIVQITDTGKLRALRYTGSSNSVKYALSTFTLTFGTWQHIYVSYKSDGNFVFGVGGVVETISALGPVAYSTAATHKIGCEGTTSSYSFYGYLDDLIIDDNVTLHTSNYTIPTAEHSIEATSTLCVRFNGTNNSTTFIDSATSKTLAAVGNAIIKTEQVLGLTANGNAKVKTSYTEGLSDITRYGDVQISTAQYKFGGSSGYFDGNGDFLGLPVRSNLKIVYGMDFTCSVWIKTSYLGSRRCRIVGLQNGNSRTNEGWLIFIPENTGKVYFSVYSSTAQYAAYDITSTTSINDGNWHHIELSVSNNVARLFIDGVREGNTPTLGINLTNPSTYFGIGNGYNYNGTWSTNYYQGYMDDLHISYGVARHTSNFSVPTSEEVSDNYTELLLKFNGANGSTDFIDSSIANPITVYPKIGTGMAVVDGRDDYVSSIFDPKLLLNKGVPFTIEFYICSLSSSRIVMS